MPVYNFETPVNYENFTKKINPEKVKEEKRKSPAEALAAVWKASQSKMLNRSGKVKWMRWSKDVFHNQVAEKENTAEGSK